MAITKAASWGWLFAGCPEGAEAAGSNAIARDHCVPGIKRRSARDQDAAEDSVSLL